MEPELECDEEALLSRLDPLSQIHVKIVLEAIRLAESHPTDPQFQRVRELVADWANYVRAIPMPSRAH